MASRFYLTIPDPRQLDQVGSLGFRSRGADGLANELQSALREDGLFKRWAATLDAPEDADPTLATVDPGATVTGEQHDLHIDLIVVTRLNGDVLRHRLRLLAGSLWQLKDVTAT
jgi:hypothetical protein